MLHLGENPVHHYTQMYYNFDLHTIISKLK